MFKRIIYDDWAQVVPIISFVLTFAVFAFTTIRACLLSKDRREQLANIPLKDSISENHPAA